MCRVAARRSGAKQPATRRGVCAASISIGSDTGLGRLVSCTWRANSLPRRRARQHNHSEAPSPFERRLLASRGIFALQNGTSAIQQCPASGICPCSLSTTLALVTLRRGRTCTFSSHTETIFHVPGSLTYLDLRRNNRHTVVAGGVRGSDIFIGRRPASHRRPPRRPLWVF